MSEAVSHPHPAPWTWETPHDPDPGYVDRVLLDRDGAGVVYHSATWDVDPQTALVLQAAPELLAALKQSNKFWSDLERGLIQAAERGFSKIDVGDLQVAVRHVLSIENAAIRKAEGR